MMIASFIFNMYFTLNSYLVVNYRTTKYYDDQDSAVFFSYFVDWIALFWIDLFKSKKRRIHMTRMAQIKNNIEIKKEQN